MEAKQEALRRGSRSPAPGTFRGLLPQTATALGSGPESPQPGTETGIQREGGAQGPLTQSPPGSAEPSDLLGSLWSEGTSSPRGAAAAGL